MQVAENGSVSSKVSLLVLFVQLLWLNSCESKSLWNFSLHFDGQSWKLVIMLDTQS